MEIIPAIDLRGGKCVRLRQGDYNRETVFGEDPVKMALRWERGGAPRLHLVDLDGAKVGTPANLEAVRAIARAVRIPCQIGGGVRDTETVRLYLEDERLVDRVIVGTQALKAPEWFHDVATRFAGRILLGLDARNSMVATAGWLEVSETSAFDLARRSAHLPLAGIVYTNIANDGMLSGIDRGTLDDLRRLCSLGPPVIASGGVTTLEDVGELARIGREHPRLQGAIVGRALYEGALSLPEALRAAAG